jgi:hypothetical protein
MRITTTVSKEVVIEFKPTHVMVRKTSELNDQLDDVTFEEILGLFDNELLAHAMSHAIYQGLGIEIRKISDMNWSR